MTVARSNIKAVRIACGARFAVAIKENQTLVQWGTTADGQRLDFPTGVKVKEVACGDAFSVAIKEDGTMIQWGSKRARVGFPDGVKVNALACGIWHAVAIKEDGTMVQWGEKNTYLDQWAGFPDGVKVKAVACGGSFSVAIKEDDTLIQWGSDKYGERNGFPEGVKVKSVHCGQYATVAVKEDGSILQWGSSREGQREQFPRSSLKFVEVAGGEAFFVGITSEELPYGDGLYQWGRMEYPHPVPQDVAPTAVACGVHFSLALLTDGSFIQWGGARQDEYDEYINFPGYVSGDESEPEYESEPEEEQLDPLSAIRDATPQTLEPNPFPKYASVITRADLPRKEVVYSPSTSAFDPVMQTDVTIEEALADPDKPLIVKVGESYSLVDRSYLQSGIDDGTLIRYGCTKALGLAVYPANIYGKNPFVYIKGLQSGNFMTLHAELAVALQSDVRAIELTHTGDVFPTVTALLSVLGPGGQNYYRQNIDLVGADHCQAGSQQRVYAITQLDLKKGGGRKKTQKRRGRGKIPKKTRRVKKSRR